MGFRFEGLGLRLQGRPAGLRWLKHVRSYSSDGAWC